MAGNYRVFADSETRPSMWIRRGLRPAQRKSCPAIEGGGVDGTAGFNVHSIAIEAPISALTRDGSTPRSATDPAAVIGVV
jgi:hypothetical protein